LACAESATGGGWGRVSAEIAAGLGVHGDADLDDEMPF
jgi:hypothetical protein